MSDYNDRHAINEALFTDGLQALIEESSSGSYDHKAPMVELENPGLHCVKSRWLRNVQGGSRVPAFYGLEVDAVTTDLRDNRYEDDRDNRVDIDNNMWTTKAIGQCGIKFECDIELFHEHVTHCCSVFPTIDFMSERRARTHQKEYGEMQALILSHNLTGKHDPYMMHIDLEAWKAEGKLWRRGTWGWHLKKHPHNYGGII